MKNIAKHTILNFKQIFKNPINFILIGSFFLISLALPLMFLPYWMTAGISMTIIIIIVCSTFFSSVNFDYRNSTLYANSKMTRGSNFTFQISTIITLAVSAFVASLIFLLIIQVLVWSKFILIGFWKNGYSEINGDDNYYVFNFQYYTLVLYMAVIESFIIFSISFLFSQMTTNKTLYFVIIMSFIILEVIFGGGFNDYYYFDYELARITNPIFPDSIYWLSMIFPFYQTSTIISEASVLTQVYTENAMNHGSVHFLDSHNSIWGLLSLRKVTEASYIGEWGWKILTITPYIHILFYLSIGLILSKLNKK